MVTIKLKGREIPLLYTTYEMKQVQDEIAPLGKVIGMVLGRNPENSEDKSGFGSSDHLKAAATLIKILGNAGLEEAGEAPDLTEKKILRAMSPMEFPLAVQACMEAMTEGMSREFPDKEDEGPVDVTLEEMKKKGTAAG